MEQRKQKLTNLLLFFFLTIVLHGQEFKGRILDKLNNIAIADALVKDIFSGHTTYSDQDGYFVLKFKETPAKLNLQITHRLYHDYQITFSEQEIPLEFNAQLIANDNVNIDLSSIQVEASDDNNNDESEVYSILGNSKNQIQQAIAFEFSLMRYRNRGINNRYDQLGMNGFLLNDFTNSQVPYYLISGQNQLTKYSENKFAYPELDEDFGAVGNNQWADVRVSNYRHGLHLNYSISNRAYTHRLGLQYVSKLASNSITYMIGANRRWAQEGAFPGTFYDAYGIYAGIQQQLNDKTSVHVLAFFAPVVRSKSAPIVNELVDYQGHLYNPYWGFQEGEKRNARMANTRVPTIMAHFEHKTSDRIKDIVGIMFSKGSRSNSNIDWTDVRDPRPDYYQSLPSFEDDPIVKDGKIKAWKNDPSTYQMNWDHFYQTNYGNIETIRNINGGSDTIRGRRSLYTLLDVHTDPQDFEIYLRRKINFTPKKNLVLNVRFENLKVHVYNRMLDLLGGDFFLDYENFIEGNQNPNSNNNNHIVRQGDIFGQDYTLSSSRLSFSQQYGHKWNSIDWTIGLEEGLNWNALNRKYQNSIFEVQKTEGSSLVKDINLSLKSLLTYKFNGRSYLLWNAGAQHINPNAEQLFINPAWRADKLPVNDQTKIYSTDLSYKYSSPELRFQIGTYASWFLDQILTRRFYLDAGSDDDPDSELLDGGFINGFYTNLDEQHMGVEAALQYNISSQWELSFVAQKGEYIYINRPQYYIYDQYSPSSDQHTIYLKNFYVAGTPQTALTAGIKYEFIKYGSIRLSANYLADSYVEINPLRRIPEAVNNLDKNSTVFKSIIDQEKLRETWVLNASIFKSWKIKNKYISASLNVNNILNNRDLVSGGFEQSRFDYNEKNVNRFPNKYFRLQGINYFFNLNYSLN